MTITKRTALKIPVELNDELNRIAKQENRTKIGLLRWFVEMYYKHNKEFIQLNCYDELKKYAQKKAKEYSKNLNKKIEYRFINSLTSNQIIVYFIDPNGNQLENANISMRYFIDPNGNQLDIYD